MYFIEDIEEQYQSEILALEIDLDDVIEVYELQDIINRCEAYRERQELLDRITALEARVEKLEQK